MKVRDVLRRIVVSGHAGNEVAAGTLKSIWKQAQLGDRP
jgi:predicted RNA binding protein YcfA (HicA-like mRNA interferase family)